MVITHLKKSWQWICATKMKSDGSKSLIEAADDIQNKGATRALYADADFRAFSQGDLPVADYCRLYKRKAEDLRDLGEPGSDTMKEFHYSMNSELQGEYIYIG